MPLIVSIASKPGPVSHPLLEQAQKRKQEEKAEKKKRFFGNIIIIMIYQVKFFWYQDVDHLLHLKVALFSVMKNRKKKKFKRVCCDRGVQEVYRFLADVPFFGGNRFLSDGDPNVYSYIPPFHSVFEK